MERGISNLDKIMAHFRQKIEDCEKQVELDTEDLKWVEREIANDEPKLKALEVEHARKLKDRELLAEEVSPSLPTQHLSAPRALRLTPALSSPASDALPSPDR